MSNITYLKMLKEASEKEIYEKTTSSPVVLKNQIHNNNHL